MEIRYGILTIGQEGSEYVVQRGQPRERRRTWSGYARA